jgi:hypothetical protein
MADGKRVELAASERGGYQWNEDLVVADERVALADASHGT